MAEQGEIAKSEVIVVVSGGVGVAEGPQEIILGKGFFLHFIALNLQDVFRSSWDGLPLVDVLQFLEPNPMVTSSRHDGSGRGDLGLRDI